MPRTLVEFAAFLAKGQPGGRALLVAVDGSGGSGKSTFTALLHGGLGGAGVTSVTTVEADGFRTGQQNDGSAPHLNGYAAACPEASG